MCARASWVCLGAKFRVGTGNRDAENPRPAGTITTFEGMAQAQGRFSIGDLTLAPLLGLGVGWFRSESDFVTIPLAGGGETFADADGSATGLRLEAGLVVAYSVVPGADIELSLSAVFAPLATNDTASSDRVGLGAPQNRAVPITPGGLGGLGSLSTRFPLNEPVVYFRSAIGLRFDVGG